MANTANPAGGTKVTNLTVTPSPAENGKQESSEYQQFENLTRNLVQVPKKELDEKLRDES